MSSPFHANSSQEVPQSILPFLGDYELSQLSQVNRTIHRRIKRDLLVRKYEVFQYLIYFFYYCNNPECMKRFTIRFRYEFDYFKNVKLVFLFLPELFEFLEDHRVPDLDLGFLESYGGYPACPFQRINSHADELKQIKLQLLDLLSKNTSLVNCNLGLFEGLIRREEIINAVENHPMLDRIQMRSSGASVYFNRPPVNLWRNRKDRTFYWDHFRHDDA